MSTKRSRNRDRHGQAVAPVCLPVVTPLCVGAFLAFAQRPRVVAPAPAPPPVLADSASASQGVVKDSAIDCNRAADTRTCVTCKTAKPLTEFHRAKANASGYRTACKACVKARDERVTGPGLAANAVAESTACAGLVTLESLTADARRLKGRAAVYQRGRVRIEARYDKRADTTTYRVGGWPCAVEDLSHVFARIHSGQPLTGLV